MTHIMLLCGELFGVLLGSGDSKGSSMDEIGILQKLG